jgi:Tfp pilus assembly protein PilX
MNATTYVRAATRRDRARGSLLIVAMLICAIIGISLASYIQLGQTAMRISNRAVYNNAAVNLAEQGIEEAIYSINKRISDPTYSWPGWTKPAADAWQKWTSVSLSQNTTGEYRVYVYNYLGTSAPKIVSRAIVTLGGGGGTIEKWIEVQLTKTSKFANGLVAKTSVTFNGNNATVDSWNSDPNGDGSVIRPFDAAFRNDMGSVGSISISNTAVVVQNADVWGYVATGGVDPTAFVGTNGSILGDPPSPGPWTKANVDPARVSTTFTATFDPVASPTTAAIAHLGTIDTAGMVLPRAADVASSLAAADGFYYYDADSINLNNKAITISGKVVIRASNTASGLAISGGNGAINITGTGALTLYTPGGISIGGQGVSNGVDGADSGTDVDQVSELNQPVRFQIYGTRTTGSQTINIAGNGLFSGVIYAPQGDVSIVGNGAVNGSVVANTINLSGNAQFHYDESLANLNEGSPFRIGRWKELTTQGDRAAYSGALTF